MTAGPAKQTYDEATYRSKVEQGNTSNTFSSNMPHRGHLLCYIAGIECPIQAATVSYGVRKIPEASITMFPDPTLQRFGAEDRVPVALFYLDEYYDPDKPAWRLLFDGEIVSWSYTNASGGRSLQFQCVMSISVWTQLFIFYMTSLNSFAGGVAAVGQDAAAYKQGQAVPGFSLLRSGLFTGDTSRADTALAGEGTYIKRPFDLAYNVIRALISDRVPVKKRAVPGINFFARWCRKEQFHNRWVALPFWDEEQANETGGSDPGIFPVLKAAQSQKAVEAVERFLLEQNSGKSIYAILENTLSVLLMEIAMIPTATCVETETDGVIYGPPKFKTNAQRTVSAKDDTLRAARLALQAAQSSGALSSEAVAAFKLAGIGYVPGDDPTPEKFTLAIANLDKKVAQTGDAGPADPKRPVRLVNYFVKPELRFGIAPIFNVLFPSMYESLQYQENYAVQPTRMYFQDDSILNLVKTKGQTNAGLQKLMLNALSHAYPPDAEAKWRAQFDKGQAASSGRNLLVWPEEFFKGPVTARYPAPPWLLFIASKYRSAGTTDAEQEQEVYKLYAQYEYFRHRFSARNGAVAGPFNPYPVPGFPLVALDDLQSQLHTMGYLMNVTHQFTAQSAQSSFNFSYGRTFSEFLEELGTEMDTGGPTADRQNLALYASPAEPIKEIRDVIQQMDNAQKFYRKVFYQDDFNKGAFDYRKYLAFIKGDGTLEDIKIEGLSETDVAATQKAMAAAQSVLIEMRNDGAERVRFATGIMSETKTKIVSEALETINQAPLQLSEQREIVSGARLNALIEKATALTVLASSRPKKPHNLSGARTRLYSPKPGTERLFDGFDAAMKECARPICTLEEYIDFTRGVREQPSDEHAFGDGKLLPGARFYGRIRRFIGTPDSFTPTDEQRGLKGTPKAIHPVDNADFPETRRQWDTILLSYRQRIYSRAEVQR